MRAAVSEPDPRVLVLYDEDCGFCRWALARLLRWDRRALIAVAPIQSAAGRRLLEDLPPERRASSWHAVDLCGVRAGGGAALPMTLRHLPGGRPLARAAARWPGAAERAYRLVADRRGWWARALSVRAVVRADAVVERRAGAHPAWSPRATAD